MNSVGLLDALLGRSKPVRPDLDQLFALPAAAVTLHAGADLVPTGLGSVCFASVEGGAFKQLQRDVRQLLDADLTQGHRPGQGEGQGEDSQQGGVPVEFSHDEYDYTWLLARHAPEELDELVGDLHAVNTLLEENGFGPQLLCSLVGFRSAEESDRPDETDETDETDAPHRPADDRGAARSRSRSLALVYLYKRGTFYPFAPQPGRKEKRDSALELQIRGLLTDDLPTEPDLGRWFPVWGAPGL